LIPFNIPYTSNKELKNFKSVLRSGKLSGNGDFTKKCQAFFEERYGFKKCLLTSSCTDALEMAALLLNIKEGDEVIMPSFTSVGTANPFVLRGATIKFVDSRSDHPGMDEDQVESLITNKTKAIVVVHYAGVACDMDKIMTIANKHHLFVVEDAAQAIDGYYKDKPLGSVGHLAAFSFHETKNISCGEGGMLVMNDEQFIERAQIIWEKGTNRSAFIRNKVSAYSWVDVGSSFQMSEIAASFLYAQLLDLEVIQKKRKQIWSSYYDGLKVLEKKGIRLPVLPDYASNNGHIFYIVCREASERTRLILYLKEQEISSVFHFQSLHNSPYYKEKHDERTLPNSNNYSETLLRLPLFYTLNKPNQNKIINKITTYFLESK